MSHIPTKNEVQQQDKSAADAATVQRRAANVQALKDGLSAAIAARNFHPQIPGNYPDDVVAEVAREFAAAGWTIKKLNQARPHANFEIS